MNVDAIFEGVLLFAIGMAIGMVLVCLFAAVTIILYRAVRNTLSRRDSKS